LRLGFDEGRRWGDEEEEGNTETRWGKGNGDQREACFLFPIFFLWLIGRRKGFGYSIWI
jgi:hypothetical protein